MKKRRIIFVVLLVLFLSVLGGLFHWTVDLKMTVAEAASQITVGMNQLQVIAKLGPISKEVFLPFGGHVEGYNACDGVLRIYYDIDRNVIDVFCDTKGWFGQLQDRLETKYLLIQSPDIEG